MGRHVSLVSRSGITSSLELARVVKAWLDGTDSLGPVGLGTIQVLIFHRSDVTRAGAWVALGGGFFLVR